MSKLPHADQLQSELIRAMTPGRRLEIAHDLYRTAWEIKAGWLRTQYPDWSEAEIQRLTRRIFLTGYAGA